MYSVSSHPGRCTARINKGAMFLPLLSTYNTVSHGVPLGLASCAHGSWSVSAQRYTFPVFCAFHLTNEEEWWNDVRLCALKYYIRAYASPAAVDLLGRSYGLPLGLAFCLNLKVVLYEPRSWAAAQYTQTKSHGVVLSCSPSRIIIWNSPGGEIRRLPVCLMSLRYG